MNPDAYTNQDDTATRVWMLFASGSASEIELTCHQNSSGSGRPVVAYPLQDCGADLVQAGDRAAEVAYSQLSLTADRKNSFRIGYDLKDLQAATHIAGGSGGLALALAMYCEMSRLPGGLIAATGEITSVRSQGAVGPVLSIQAKLEKALTLIEPGGRVFYPAAQQNEIPHELLQDFDNKDILLHPVESVTEAIALLVGNQQRYRRPLRKSKKYLLTAVLITCLAGMLLYMNLRGAASKQATTPQPSPEQSEKVSDLSGSEPISETQATEPIATAVQEVKAAPVVDLELDAASLQTSAPPVEEPVQNTATPVAAPVANKGYE